MKLYKAALLKITAFLMTAVIFVAMGVPEVAALAQETPVRTVKVGFFAFPGYHEMDENGTRRGYGVDFLLLLQRYANLRYEYVGYEHTWEDMQRMLLNGDIDMVTSARKTPEREQLYSFSEEIGSSDTEISVRADDDRYQSGDYGNWNGITVGVLAGSSRNEDFAKYAKEKGFTFKVKTYASENDLTNALKFQNVDAIVASSLRKHTGEKTIAKFSPEDFYVMVRKGDTDLLKELNYGIEQMNINEGNWRNNLYYKNYSDRGEDILSFTSREQQYIQDVQAGKKTITAAAQPDRDPYSFVENGQMTGIIPDYFAYLMKMAGLPYEVLIPKDREEYEKWGYENRADVFMDCRFDRPATSGFDFGVVTDPYMQLTMARVTKKNFTSPVQTVATAQAQGFISIDENIAEDASYITVPSREAAMEAVRDGKADACYVYTYMASKFINRNQGENLTYNILESPVYNEYIYIKSTTDHELASILNKCIRADRTHYINELVNKYTEYQQPKMTIFRFLKENPLFTGVLFLAISGFSLVIWLLLKNSRNMKKMADERLAYAGNLQSKNEELEKANQAKREFLFNMSHDMRTPMNAILGFSELAQKHVDDSKKNREYLAKITQAGDNLLELINNVLEMSKIESGQVSLEEEICDFMEISQSIDVSFEKSIKEKNLKFRNNFHISGRKVWADPTKVRQIFANIIGNAVKYTPKGGSITCTVRETPSEKKGYVVFTTIIQDTGIGISKEFLPHIFDQFERERNTTATGIEGSGLGLAIVKRTVTLMGGSIQVESEQGKGTKVTVAAEHRLAQETEEQKEERSEPESETLSVSGKRILIAEDNELNAEIAAEVLSEAGFKTERAADGVQCIQMLSEAPAGFYDLILMDIQMPNMNGYTAAAQIRRLSDPKKALIPIVAMTANAFEEDKKRALSAGMDGFVSKPVDVGKLLETLGKILKEKS